ncbi:MAG: hypothetical protein IJ568_06790 [Bacilli bacterium]|nr:hypothetical protein [Bacilli bacterium]
MNNSSNGNNSDISDSQSLDNIDNANGMNFNILHPMYNKVNGNNQNHFEVNQILNNNQNIDGSDILKPINNKVADNSDKLIENDLVSDAKAKNGSFDSLSNNTNLDSNQINQILYCIIFSLRKMIRKNVLKMLKLMDI